MIDDHDGCEWVMFLLVPSHPVVPDKIERQYNGCVCVCVCRWGDLIGILAGSFRQKTSVPALYDDQFSRFDRTRTCDGQKHGQEADSHTAWHIPR